MQLLQLSEENYQKAQAELSASEEALSRKSDTGARFEVFLEGDGFGFILKRAVPDHLKRSLGGGVGHTTLVVVF